MIIAEFGEDFLEMYRAYTSASPTPFYQSPKIYLHNPYYEVVPSGVHKARILGSRLPFNSNLGYSEFILVLELDVETNIEPYALLCVDPYTSRSRSFFRAMATYLLENTGWMDIVAGDVTDPGTVAMLRKRYNSDVDTA